MEFGKLPSVDSVDFSLPSEPLQNAGLLKMWQSLRINPGCYAGGTGYNMKEWVGTWYPAGTKEKDFLSYYGAQFNTIEHNTTYYRVPDTFTIDRWREETPADFRFCPKIPQSISHDKDLGIKTGQIPIFCDAIAGLDSKLGCCFLQLPPAFSTQKMPLLVKFLDQFPSEIPLAIEVRHPSFFDASAAAAAYFKLLEERRVATVITDVAGRRDVCHMRLTAGTVLVRFVGNALDPTDFTRITEWTERISSWLSGGLPAVYFFTHEPDNLLAPELAAFFVESMKNRMPDLAIRGPKPITPSGGVQGSLF